MTRQCEITGKKPQYGHNVSHSNRHTKRRFLPNLQARTFVSDLLGKAFSLRVSTSAIRTVDKHHGLDSFLLQTKAKEAELMSPEVQKIRKQLRKMQKAEAPAAKA